MNKCCANCKHGTHWKQVYELCKCKHAIVLIDDYCDKWEPT